jgi:hypothetical protein
MALRKYQEDAALASPSQETAAPVAETSPATTEAGPPATETPQPAEPFEGPGPAEEAAKTAMQTRLAENERAFTFTPPSPQGPQYTNEEQPQGPLTTEQIIEASGLPQRAQNWLREHPQYIRDPGKNATIIALHDTAKRQAGGEEWTPAYFEKMESLLGMRPEPEPRPQPRPQVNRNQRVQPQQYRGAPTSAPPSREVPSMSSGRPVSYRVPLNADEREIALSTRPDPRMTPEQAYRLYEQNKERARKRVVEERGYQ